MLSSLIDLIATNRRMDAINLIQVIFDTGPTEAVTAVDKMLEGETLESALSVFFPDKTSLPHPADIAIHASLLAGNKIEAIKRYRELHNVGLKEAKEAIESFYVSSQLPQTRKNQPPSETDKAKIDALVSERQLFEAIKLYRKVYNVDLKQAKEMVEALDQGKHMSKLDAKAIKYFALAFLFLMLGILMVVFIAAQ